MKLDSSPIVAIATPPGRGGIGIVRISGNNLLPLAQDICKLPHAPDKPLQLTPRHATYTDFVRADGSVIDSGLALYFVAPHSYTGEEVLELQGHGGPIVMQMLLDRCLEAGIPHGLRLAHPGEFTYRAFLNDKLDLAQAEAVSDLIEASSEAAAKLALQSLSGAFSDQIRSLVEQVIALRLLVEATLDFPEEEIEFLEKSNARGQLQTIRNTLDQVFSQAAQGSILREGLKVVLAGQPNVGKSSLLNALAGSDVAIVTSVAGTTRDKIIETIHVDGIPINIIDTAGIRDAEETPDEVERIGISRTWDALEHADVVMHILDASRGPTRGDDEILARLPDNIPVIRIWNKIDLSGHRAMSETLTDATHIYLSAAEHTGMELLRKELLAIAGWQQTGESAYLARERHLIALQAAQSHLQSAATLSEQSDQSLDLFAEELRLAQDNLNSITGEFTSDDLLGAIFSRFCIGK